MRKPSLKSGLFFIAVWLGFFLLLRQLDPGGSLSSRPLAIPLPLFALILTGAGARLDGALCFSRRAWRLADTPIARIRPAPQGYIELYGRARLLPGPPILAPLSSLPCAWYRYQIEERSSGGRWWSVESGDRDNLSLWTTALPSLIAPLMAFLSMLVPKSIPDHWISCCSSSWSSNTWQ